MPIPRIEAGQFVRFTYRPPAKPVRSQQPRREVVQQRQPDGSLRSVEVMRKPPPPEAPSNPSKEVFVLHPHWNNKVHGLDLARVTPAEQQVLRAIMDPKTAEQVKAGTWPVEGVPNYPLIRDVCLRMDPTDLIKNPLAFYQRFVKPFIRDKDCYRQYWPNYMYGLQVVQESQVQGPVMNPKPLFHK